MNPPDSKPSGQVVTSSPATVLAETGRALAAIVFTDAANFSAVMSRDEARAQRMITRDLAGMCMVCEENGGQVLKSTGDGLLMIFGSAVRAVSCALEIQVRLREQNRSLPFAERLSHRIGIHLGDVFRQENDVVGDGVNIAARLEAIGWRGCVCVSGTVYEVVQNRLPFYVLRRKEQKLKNVGKIVVYQLAPASGRFKYLLKAWTFISLCNPRVVRIIAGLAILLSLGLLPAKVSLVWADLLGSFGDPLHKYAVELGEFGNVDDEEEDDETASPSSSGSYPAMGKKAVSEDEFAVERFNDIKKYDFAALGDWLARNDVRDRDGDKLRIVCTSIQQLLDWCRARLQTYSEANPLIIRDVEGGVAYQFWSVSNGGIACKLPSSERSLANDEIPPVIMGQMLARLLEQDTRPDDPDSEKLWRGLKFFTSVYQIDLPSPLKKEMNQHAKAAVRQAGNS